MDQVDQQVVGCLLEDARGTYAEIGDRVGLSAPAVLGWTTEAYVEVYCKGAVAPQDLRRSLEKVPEVVGACTVSGSADALLHLLAWDIAQLERAIERVRDEPDVDHTVTVIVLSRLIDRPRS